MIGLAVGYYYGAKAGRDRYDEIERWLDKVRGTPQYLDVRAKVDDLCGQGRRNVRGLIDDATGGASESLLDLRNNAVQPFDEPTA
jgi:hypothetical protein